MSKEERIMFDKEERVFESSMSVEMRKKDGSDTEVPFLRGHAAVFNKLSDNLGGFREKITPGAFDDVLSDDVRALFNHDSNFILGRTASNTLTIGQDKKGLSYEVELPDTQVGRDLAISVERGDISQSSFAFTVEEDSWDEDDEGRIVRTITKIRKLFDVSPVTYPAYPDATVGVRSMENYMGEKKSKSNGEVDILKRKMRLHEMNEVG